MSGVLINVAEMWQKTIGMKITQPFLYYVIVHFSSPSIQSKVPYKAGFNSNFLSNRPVLEARFLTSGRLSSLSPI